MLGAARARPRLRRRPAGLGDPRLPVRPRDVHVLTQLVPYQRMQLFGTTGRVEIEIPFNAPDRRAVPDLHRRRRATCTAARSASRSSRSSTSTRVQGDLFARGDPDRRPGADAARGGRAQHGGHRRRVPQRRERPLGIPRGVGSGDGVRRDTGRPRARRAGRPRDHRRAADVRRARLPVPRQHVHRRARRRADRAARRPRRRGARRAARAPVLERQRPPHDDRLGAGRPARHRDGPRSSRPGSTARCVHGTLPPK